MFDALSKSDSIRNQPEDNLDVLTSSKLPHREYDYHPLRNHLDRWGSPSADNNAVTPHWSVPWSDLMMVMMVMFAILFFLQRAESNVGDSFRKKIKKGQTERNRPCLPFLFL